MKLNVFGTKLEPYIPDNIFTTETAPICIKITENFKNWAYNNGFSNVINGLKIDSLTKIEPEIWIMSYKENCAPPMIAKYSHEKAVYWFSLDLFE